MQGCIALGNPLSKALHVLVPQADSETTPSTMSPFDEAQHNGGGKTLPLDVYDSILTYLNMLLPSSPIWHFKDLPHPMDTFVLPPMAVPLHHLQHKGRSYSTFTMHPGNSSISYRTRSGGAHMGFIVSMWAQVVMGKSHIFVIVSPHRLLSAGDEKMSPYQSRPGFLSSVVYSQQSDPHQAIVMEKQQIIAHVAYYSHPPGTFGIGAETLVLINSLHCNQD